MTDTTNSPPQPYSDEARTAGWRAFVAAMAETAAAVHTYEEIYDRTFAAIAEAVLGGRTVVDKLNWLHAHVAECHRLQNNIAAAVGVDTDWDDAGRADVLDAVCRMVGELADARLAADASAGTVSPVANTTGQIPAIPDDAREQLGEALWARGVLAMSGNQARELADAALLVVRAWRAGHTVVELPEPEGKTGEHVWPLGDRGEVTYYRQWDDHSVEVETPHENLTPDDAERYGLALIAAAREARRLAAESGQDGEPDA